MGRSEVFININININIYITFYLLFFYRKIQEFTFKLICNFILCICKFIFLLFLEENHYYEAYPKSKVSVFLKSSFNNLWIVLLLNSSSSSSRTVNRQFSHIVFFRFGLSLHLSGKVSHFLVGLKLPSNLLKILDTTSSHFSQTYSSF